MKTNLEPEWAELLARLDRCLAAVRETNASFDEERAHMRNRTRVIALENALHSQTQPT